MYNLSKHCLQFYPKVEQPAVVLIKCLLKRNNLSKDVILERQGPDRRKKPAVSWAKKLGTQKDVGTIFSNMNRFLPVACSSEWNSWKPIHGLLWEKQISWDSLNTWYFTLTFFWHMTFGVWKSGASSTGCADLAGPACGLWLCGDKSKIYV